MNSRFHLKKFLRWAVCFYLPIALPGGCDSGPAVRSADQDIYKTVADKWDKDFGAESRRELAIEEWIGETRILSLSDAVAFATGHSGLYQEEKDLLGYQGLDLILASYQLSGFSRPSDAGLAPEGSGKTVSGTISTTAELAEAWSAVLTEAQRKGSPPELKDTLAEPLQKKIRWEDNAAERRLQWERDTLYQIRSFHHFRKKFTVWIAIGYYRVLQGQDAVTSALEHHQALAETCDKLEKMLDIGQIQKTELDRAYQEKFLAWERYLDVRRNYEQLLDQFKLESGIPIRTEMHLDAKELELLKDRFSAQEMVPREEAVESVLESRLDLANQADALTDRLRKIFQAAYNPQGRLHGIDYRRKAPYGQIEYATLEYLENQFILDFDEKMPFDLLSEHNEFRKDLMKVSQQHREYGGKVDKIIADVRAAYRDWEEGTERYRLQVESLKLAEKRVKDGLALLSSGRANVGDILRARNDLYEAQIQAIDALVDSAVAILQIQVQPDSLWRKWDWKN